MQTERWSSPLALKEFNIVYLLKSHFQSESGFLNNADTFVENKWNRMYDYRERINQMHCCVNNCVNCVDELFR